MIKRVVLILAILIPGLVWAAGTVVTDEYQGAIVKMVKFAWTSNATGSATDSTLKGYSGEILKVMFDPGTPEPSAAFDVTLTDGTDLDVLNGQGSNLSNSTTAYADVNATFPITTGNLDLAVENAGNATQGAVYIWIK